MPNTDYPRMMFHRTKEPVVIHSRDEEDALGKDWARIIWPAATSDAEPEPEPAIAVVYDPPPLGPEPEPEPEPEVPPHVSRRPAKPPVKPSTIAKKRR